METTTSGPFTCPNPDGVFPLSPDACVSEFYTCVSGNAYLTTCPFGGIFDPAVSICVSAEVSSCSPATPPTTSTTMGMTTAWTNPTSAPFNCPESDGVFPLSPNACVAEYYICVSGNAYLSTCPFGGIFDPIVSTCVSAGASSCLSSTAPETSSTSEMTTTTMGMTTAWTNPSSAPFLCPNPDGVFPLTSSTCASEYYICVSGNAYLSTCPFGAIFDPAVSICVPANTASCSPTSVTTPGSASTTGSTTTSSTTSNPGPFTCPDADGVFANPNDCGSYYSCSNSRPILQLCPPGTVFNPPITSCDFPFNVPGCENGRRSMLRS